MHLKHRMVAHTEEIDKQSTNYLIHLYKLRQLQTLILNRNLCQQHRRLSQGEAPENLILLLIMENSSLGQVFLEEGRCSVTGC